MKSSIQDHSEKIDTSESPERRIFQRKQVRFASAQRNRVPQTNYQQSSSALGQYGVTPSIKDFRIMQKIGSGDDLNFVLKQIDVDDDNKQKQATQEIKVMQTLNHPYIIKFIDSFADEKRHYIVMELCERGDLGNFIQRYTQSFAMQEVRVWRFVIQLCLALEYIHSKGIIHSDLKPQNILLTGKDYDVKLADFGITQILTQNYLYSHTHNGTLYYCSPEVCMQQPYNQKTDVWALGCIIYELCTQRKAFDGVNDENLKNKIINFQNPQIPSENYSSDLSMIYNLCMEKDQNQRPDVSQILRYLCVIKQAQQQGIPIGFREPIDIQQSIPEVKLTFVHRRNSTLSKFMPLSKSQLSGYDCQTQSSTQPDSPLVIRTKEQKVETPSRPLKAGRQLSSTKRIIVFDKIQTSMKNQQVLNNQEFYRDILKKHNQINSYMQSTPNKLRQISNSKKATARQNDVKSYLQSYNSSNNSNNSSYINVSYQTNLPNIKLLQQKIPSTRYHNFSSNK
ncbi:serine threonine-protein [Stylonychia lemnae]|uniref:non-specific serine/threonine protein kinase n=1 Tax=Stylonychia lemnae TaxID=5949 RepID=A0A078AMS4_STYLE|nr:serine threonine-protein [Stylonychia lemnae]|eukprot:CDW83454.1 serine threonine-protein [Stylonychia lemnae]